MFNIDLNSTYTLILAIILFLFGSVLKNNLKFLNNFCIPSPVIGGLFFCILTLCLNYFGVLSISMDTSLMPHFMSFFFTVIGLGVSLSLVKKGGKLLIKYWLLCGLLAYCQNGLTVILSKVCNIHPLLGLMCGTISMEGGHGCAAAFGATIENLGINDATSVGIAAATLGLILGILFLFGSVLKNNLKFLNNFCIPSPVIGGLFFCILALCLNYFGVLSISMDTSLMPHFMSFFFTVIGLGVSLSLVKKGGKLLIKYWLLCGLLAYCQNGLTVILSKVCNIHPLLGLMCGTISMEGGHGCAAAFGATIENLGIKDATSVGIAAATLGLILGGILGGPIAKYLIEKYKLKPSNKTNTYSSLKNSTVGVTNTYSGLTPYMFFEQFLLVLLCMTLGEFITNLFYNITNIILPSVVGSMFIAVIFRNVNDKVNIINIDLKLLDFLSELNLFYNITNIILPSVVGSMFIAVIFRNVNDKVNIINIDLKLLDFLSELSLGMFLTMALMSVDLLKLSNLFGPIVFIIICQVFRNVFNYGFNEC